MKQRIITTLAALICFAVGYAGNISVGNVSLKPGETKDLVISLGSGVSDMCGVQFDVTLSEGISLVQDDDEKEYKISSVQPNDLVCELSNLGNGTYRFIMYSSSLKKLKTGELMSLHLKASSDKNLGNYALTFGGIAFSNENGAVTKESGINATVKVTDFFTLLYKVDGEDYKSYEVEYGATITPEPAPTKEGYTFSGWSEIPETMPANNVTITGSFTAIILPGSMTPPVAKSDLVYNGAAQDLITAGTSTTGTVQYSLDGTTYSTSIPQGTNAGNYTVYYRVKGDANHSDVAAQNFSVTIAAKTVDNPTITLSQTSYTFDGTAKEPTVTVKDGGTTIPSTEYSVSYTNNTNVGTATVTITDVEGGNYTVSGSTTFAISSADGSLTPPSGISNLVYTGKAQNLITAGSTNTGTMQYSLDGTTYATSIPQGTDAGSYTVYYRVKGDANHNDIAAQHFDVKIAKAPLKVSVGNYEIIEGEAIPAFDAKYEGFVNNETADVLTTKPSISCEATNSSPAGEYKVKASGAEAKNYEISYVDGKLTILAKKFEAGGDDNKDEDDTATYQITSQGSGSDTPPTVAITDDAGVSDAFDIPEEVVHNGVTYKVTEIGEGTFENNTNLTEVTIPSSITSIGDKAFKGCSNLKSITLYITTPISLAVAGTRGAMTRADGNSVFDGVDKATCILYVPEGSVDLYKAAPVWKDFQNILAIGTTGIKELIMPDGEAHAIYDLQGRKVRAKSASLEGLPRGIYIINGKKISIK